MFLISSFSSFILKLPREQLTMEVELIISFSFSMRTLKHYPRLPVRCGWRNNAQLLKQKYRTCHGRERRITLLKSFIAS